MARKKRIWYPGAFYHVMSRGNHRNVIFREHEDYIYFLRVIQILREKYAFRIHTLCLMTNHFHMILETSDVEIWKIMQKLLSLYAEEFNYRYDCSGHLFEGRYTACLIEEDSYFLEVSRYIHLNPVKAGMVKKPIDYQYSSYLLFASNTNYRRDSEMQDLLSGVVDISRILGVFSNSVQGLSPYERYCSFVEDRMPHEEYELRIRTEMKEDD